MTADGVAREIVNATIKVHQFLDPGLLESVSRTVFNACQETTQKHARPNRPSSKPRLSSFPLCVLSVLGVSARLPKVAGWVRIDRYGDIGI